MVRGLDYYTRTTFEFITDALGAQAAVGAGGRYDGLLRQLNGPDLPGIGFALGMERLILLMEQQEDRTPPQQTTDLFVAALGEKAAVHASMLVHALRRLGLAAAMDYSGRSLKAQMKQAGRVNSRFTLIIGDNELAGEEGILRDMNSQEQTRFSLSPAVDEQAQQMAAILSA